MGYKHTENIAEGLVDASLNSGRDFLDYDPVGLPDDKDAANINTMIRNFEKHVPGVIRAFVAEAKRLREEPKGFILGTASDKPTRRVLTMPTPLLREIEEAYPLMFRNREHLRWFKKNYPQFVSATR